MSGGSYETRTLPELSGYTISSDGRIQGPSGRWLACTPSGNGYRMFSAGRRPQTRWYVHQVVAKAFLGPRPPGQEVAHLNGDQLDNRAANLAYKTRAGNQADRVLHGTSNRGEQHPLAKLSAGDVEEIRRRYAAGGILQKELAGEYGVSREAISRVVRADDWKHVGPLNVVSGDNHPSSRKTHCPRGHAYSQKNTYIDPRGYRHCRECRRR